VTNTVFAAAVDDRVISEAPCRRIRLPKGDDAKAVPPTVEQLTAVSGAIGTSVASRCGHTGRVRTPHR